MTQCPQCGASVGVDLLDPRQNLTLTIDEVIALLGTGRTATYEAVRSGQLGAVITIGRRTLIPTANLRRMLGLDEPCAGPTSAESDARASAQPGGAG